MAWGIHSAASITIAGTVNEAKLQTIEVQEVWIPRKIVIFLSHSLWLGNVRGHMGAMN